MTKVTSGESKTPSSTLSPDTERAQLHAARNLIKNGDLKKGYKCLFQLADASTHGFNTYISKIVGELVSYDFIKAALKHGMSPAILIPDESPTSIHPALPLPYYLARTEKLQILLLLLEKGKLRLSDCGVSPEDMWRHITISETEVPMLCAIMEHFGDALQSAPVMPLTQWLHAHPTLTSAVTTELSRAHPRFARLVVEATPVNTQAVSIAAAHGFVDWLYLHSGHLAASKPEGYLSWAALVTELCIKRPMATETHTALLTVAAAVDTVLDSVSDALATGRVEAARDMTVARAEEARLAAAAETDTAAAALNPCLTMRDMGSLPETCAQLERLGADYQEQIHNWVRGFPDKDVPALVAELCSGGHRGLAQVVAEKMYRVRAFDELATFFNFTNHIFTLSCPAHEYLGRRDLDDAAWKAIQANGFCSNTEEALQLFAGIHQTGCRITSRVVADYRHHDGCSYLHHAARHDTLVDAARALILARADVNSRARNDCKTPLHEAAIHGCLGAAQCLVEAGASPSLAITDTEKGKTPMAWARARNKPAVAKYLQSVGGVC